MLIKNGCSTRSIQTVNVRFRRIIKPRARNPVRPTVVGSGTATTVSEVTSLAPNSGMKVICGEKKAASVAKPPVIRFVAVPKNAPLASRSRKSPFEAALDVLASCPPCRSLSQNRHGALR